MRPLPFLPAAFVAGFVVAQERLPVPDAAQLAVVRDEVARFVAEAAGLAPFPWTADRLLASVTPAVPAPLRYELLQQVIALSVGSGDVANSLRAAEALETTFAVPPQRDAVLALLEGGGCAAAQALAHAHLESAICAAGADPARFARSLDHAVRVARKDDPPGLRAAVEARCNTLRQLVDRATEEDPAVTLLAVHPRFVIGGIAQVEPTYTEADDFAALARIGERLLADRRHEADPLVLLATRRRALSLLKPFATLRFEGEVDLAEVRRVRRLVERTSALAVEPEVGALRFETAADLERLRIGGGRWSVASGQLRGASLGADVETCATARFAWHRIDSVTVHGGVWSDAASEFWIAVGTVEVLLRSDGPNVVYFEDERIPVVPGVLEPRREHAIVLRQCGGQVTVIVDGRPVRTGSGDLAGTVSVWPANGSEIFVRAIDIVGDVDLARVVPNPDPAR